MLCRKAGFLLALWSLLLLGLTTTAAQATVYTWNGGNANWSVPGNWSPATGPPNNYDIAIIPAGTVHIDSSSLRGYSVSELNVGAGATVLVTDYGLGFNTDNPAKTCLATNNGSIQIINPSATETSSLDAIGNVVTLTGGGEVVLGGLNNGLRNGGHGGSFINDTSHTIRGGGYIQAGVIHKGRMVADNGTLYLQAPIVNESNIRVEGAGNAIDLYSAIITGGWLYPQDGKITMRSWELVNLNLGPGSFEVTGNADWSRTFRGTIELNAATKFLLDPGLVVHLDNAGDGTPPILTNNAVINLNGQGSGFYSAVASTLTGTGSIVMGGDLNNTISGPLTQGTNHTIEGGGDLRFITNNGTIQANNGVLSVMDVTNNGIFEVADNATLNLTGSLTTANLFLPLQSNFLWSATLILSGNFAFAQQNVAKMTCGTFSTLKMNGPGPWQSIEVGGKDLRRVAAGFTNNFAPRNLRLEGTNTQAYLVDNIDNGNRSPGVREALYASTLYVAPGTTLNLNSIHLYTYTDEIRQVQAGDGLHYGGGEIIDVPINGHNLPPIINLLLD